MRHSSALSVHVKVAGAYPAGVTADVAHGSGIRLASADVLACSDGCEPLFADLLGPAEKLQVSTSHIVIVLQRLWPWLCPAVGNRCLVSGLRLTNQAGFKVR